MTRNSRLLSVAICLFTLLGGATHAHARMTQREALAHIRAATTRAKLHRVSTDAGQVCDLQMSVTCDGNGCTSTTRNNGASSCSGEYFIGFFSDLNRPQLIFSNFTNTLGVEDFCFDSSDPELGTDSNFEWCFGEGSLAPGASFTAHVNVARGANVPALLPVIALTEVTDPNTEDDLAFVYAANGVRIATCTPLAAVPPITQSGTPYSVTWSQVSDQNSIYQIDESTSADFSTGLTTATVQGLSKSYQHTVGTTTAYYYRVRSTSCGGSIGPNSDLVSIVVQSNPPQNARNVDTVVPAGSTTPVSFQLFVPGSGSGKTALDTAFTAVTDKPYLSVSPSSGTIPPGGTTLTVTANPTDLPPGANTGTLAVTSTSTGTPVATVPVSISLVTPVGPSPKSLPTADTLIIPVVTHVNGATSPFQSDVRVTNAGSASQTYLLTFTPTRTDATLSSRATTLTVTSGQTIALNDIAKDFFGFGASGNPSDVGFGSLEIRSLGGSTAETYASSRTYATTSAGTFGQFIGAVPFFGFVGPSVDLPIPGSENPPRVLSLQQIAQSTKFRTNLGIVEGSGNPASGTIRILDDNGTLLKSVPYSLLPGEHQQLNAFLAGNGITLDDGRIEITVNSATGAVSAYASVLDNITTDPLAVQPVVAADILSSRYVLPGMADLNNGAANFHSDIRIYNSGSTPETVNLTYFPQQNPAGAKTAAPITIAAGQVKAIDNVLPSLFNATNSGGSILITTAGASSLVTTGRTYSIGANNGTFGQFIPGIAPEAGIGAGDTVLQILQLEQSNNFRSNVGLAELTGNPVRVRVSLILPDSKVTPFVELDMAGNEFRQLNAVIGSFNPGKNTYNARITVQVLSGTGRVTAYGSVIDNATQDPTYVPAQ